MKCLQSIKLSQIPVYLSILIYLANTQEINTTAPLTQNVSSNSSSDNTYASTATVRAPVSTIATADSPLPQTSLPASLSDNNNNVTASNSTTTISTTISPSTSDNFNSSTTTSTGIDKFKPVKAVSESNDCSQRDKLTKQPKPTAESRLRKCCPLGENLDVYRENQSDSICDVASMEFKPAVIHALLYNNCIEDLEIETTLEYEIGIPCNSSFQYDDTEDNFFVLQDGTLLVMDKTANVSYSIETNYCLDMDKSGHMVAFTCITQVEEHLSRGQIVTLASAMLCSLICLLVVSYLHIKLRLLRTLHGLSLSLMSFCLAAGFFFHAVVHIIYGIPSSGFIGYVIQFFILSYYFWFFCICCNVIVNIWYKLPRCVQLSKTWNYINFGLYCLFAFTGPAVLVALTVQKGLQGMPSYFIQGLTESIRESQRYFIPPVSTLLGLSFVVMVISFFGFQRIKTHGYLRADQEERTANAPTLHFDQLKYEEVKKDAKCVSLWGIILIVTWFLEIITFYSTGPDGVLLLCDLINGLQGVFVLLIFLVVRRRRTVIQRWWYDRGSHQIEGTEMQTVIPNVKPK